MPFHCSTVRLTLWNIQFHHNTACLPSVLFYKVKFKIYAFCLDNLLFTVAFSRNKFSMHLIPLLYSFYTINFILVKIQKKKEIWFDQQLLSETAQSSNCNQAAYR